jgi:PII-like signaling protein
VVEIPSEACLLRIHLGESDQYHGKPLYEAIVLQARKLHLAGATVLRGVMGFGARSRIHAAKILSISNDLPVVVEIVDERRKIDLLLPFLEEHLADGLITLERVEVLHYHSKSGSP